MQNKEEDDFKVQNEYKQEDIEISELKEVVKLIKRGKSSGFLK